MAVKYTDILIEDDDIKTDSAGQPVYIYDRDVIAQDIRHAIRESGLPTQLIGQRDRQQRALVLKRIKQTVEADPRVVPGTSSVKENFVSLNQVQLSATANTEFGPIEIGV